VIVKEALANGRLTARGDVPELVEAARTGGCTPDALALAAVLAQPWADVVSGAAAVEALESNLAQLALRVEPELLDAIGQDPVDYWQTRASLAWN
jgi:aryl-alcohol dehydrogenase-like predicted oxidoreductase